MAKQLISIKRLQIDKSNANTIAFLAISSAIVVFSLVASRALMSQRSYQARVIAQKQLTLNQLRANNQAASELATAFQVFQEPANNIIGGTKTGATDKDGDNAKIVLDALPSKYDFPALTASLDKILGNQGFKVSNINGTDDEVNQSQQASTAAPIAIPFEVTVSGTFNDVQGAIDILQRSIRPIQLVRIELGGSNGTLGAKISALTYYQPEKAITITTKEIK